jgi:hypothetical protein
LILKFNSSIKIVQVFKRRFKLMSPEVGKHDVHCPKGYGYVNFIMSAGGCCPVSGSNSCKGCDVIPEKEVLEDKDRQVKSKQVKNK